MPPLRASASLTSAATWQSQALARAGYLDHTSPDGSTLIDRLTRVRWRGTAAGEDLAVASQRLGAPCAMWLQSPGHRANLLSPSFRTVGLGARARQSGTAAARSTSPPISAPDERRGREVHPSEGVWPLKE